MRRIGSIDEFKAELAELATRSPVVAVVHRIEARFVAVAVPLEARSMSFWVDFEAPDMRDALAQLGTKVLFAVDDPNLGTGTLPPPYPPPKLMADPEALANAVEAAILALHEMSPASP